MGCCDLHLQIGLFYLAINYMRMKELTPYIVEKLRRTKIRKQRRKDKRKEIKHCNYWNKTWYANGKLMQNCDYFGTCEFPCNGDC